MGKIDRLKTHINGLDTLIGGGFLRGSLNLLRGKPGTGKTIFSLQFLYNGAKNDNQKGFYFTFEEKKEALYEQATQFGWDLAKFEKSGKLRIISIGYENIGKHTVEEMLEVIGDIKPDRIVIDSINTLSFLTGEQGSSSHYVERYLYKLLAKIKEFKNVASIIISQKDNYTQSPVTGYICDSILEIEYGNLGGDFSRSIMIPKMRRTKNSEDIHPVEISKEGIIVHNLD